MNGRRKPRIPRVIGHPTALLQRAVLRVTLYTPAEIADLMAPMKACFKALREGVATHDQFIILETSLKIAQGIERSGIVRGLHEHFASAMTAMASIEARALAGDMWERTALHWHELDALDIAVDLHEFQLTKLSAGELQPIVKRLINVTTSSGGQVEFVSPSKIGVDNHVSA